MSWRIRSGVGRSRWSAAGAAGAMCLLRVVWMAAGVSAALDGRAAQAGAAYVFTAWAATLLSHRSQDAR